MQDTLFHNDERSLQADIQMQLIGAFVSPVKPKLTGQLAVLVLLQGVQADKLLKLALELHVANDSMMST